MNCNIVVRIEEFESREKLMNRGTITLHFHQYDRKALEDHLPWTIMMNGLMLRRNRCVVPLIQKEWPNTGDRNWEVHRELHQVKNHVFCIGDQLPSRVLKANSGVASGRVELVDRCDFRA